MLISIEFFYYIPKIIKQEQALEFSKLVDRFFKKLVLYIFIKYPTFYFYAQTYDPKVTVIHKTKENVKNNMKTKFNFMIEPY